MRIEGNSRDLIVFVVVVVVDNDGWKMKKVEPITIPMMMKRNRCSLKM